MDTPYPVTAPVAPLRCKMILDASQRKRYDVDA